MTRNGWVRALPRPELNLIHHALRLMASDPRTSEETCDEAVLLADLLWAESTSRREEVSTS